MAEGRRAAGPAGVRGARPACPTRCRRTLAQAAHQPPAPPERLRRALLPPVLLRRGLPGDRQATRRHRLRAGAPTELRRRCADLVLRGRRHSSLVSPRAIAQHSSPWLARIDRQLPTCAMAEGSRAAQDSPTVGASPECRAASARAACGADPRRAALAASFAAGDSCLPAVLLRRRLPADRQAALDHRLRSSPRAAAASLVQESLGKSYFSLK
jgi:hypothetical protein